MEVLDKVKMLDLEVKGIESGQFEETTISLSGWMGGFSDGLHGRPLPIQRCQLICFPGIKKGRPIGRLVALVYRINEYLGINYQSTLISS